MVIIQRNVLVGDNLNNKKIELIRPLSFPSTAVGNYDIVYVNSNNKIYVNYDTTTTATLYVKENGQDTRLAAKVSSNRIYIYHKNYTFSNNFGVVASIHNTTTPEKKIYNFIKLTLDLNLNFNNNNISNVYFNGTQVDEIHYDGNLVI